MRDSITGPKIRPTVTPYPMIRDQSFVPSTQKLLDFHQNYQKHQTPFPWGTFHIISCYHHIFILGCGDNSLTLGSWEPCPGYFSCHLEAEPSVGSSASLGPSLPVPQRFHEKMRRICRKLRVLGHWRFSCIFLNVFFTFFLVSS
jgi:hypothetical protein